MKVGDLVELSARGLKLQHVKVLHGLQGIVISQSPHYSGVWLVYWFERNFQHRAHKREFLKIVKKTEKST